MSSRPRVAALLIISFSLPINLACDQASNKQKAQFVRQEKLAGAGNSEAQNWMSVQFANGDGFVKADPKMSFHWAEKAANSGNAASQYSLAMYYEYGTAVTPNIEKAVDWYKRCASNGRGKWQSDALNKLALLTWNGTNTGETESGAYEWITNSAIQNNPYACFTLGILHQRVGYTEEDQRIAKALFESGAEQGFSRAQLLLGILYFNAKYIRHDQEKAFFWVQKSAQQNYPDAQLLLSVFYEKGVGTSANKELSIEWREKAENQAKSDGTESNFKLAGLLLRSENPNAK